MMMMMIMTLDMLSLLMKLFKAYSIAVIKDCCRCFGFELPSELLERRFKKFMFKRGF